MRRLEPDRVEATAYFLYVTSSGDDGSKIGWGSYRDTYVRHDGRLVVQAKHITMDLLVDAREGWGAAMRGAGSAVNETRVTNHEVIINGGVIA